MSWTDERVDVLRKLWAEGLSASQIAAELGGVTRNAVIGKVHRLGLSGRAKPSQSSSNRQKRTSTRSGGYSKGKSSANRVTGAINAATDAAAPVKSNIVVDIPKPESRELNLLQLTEHTCKWPSGDPQHDDFSFCGNKPREGDPYCEYHCRLAYQPAAERRSRNKKVGSGIR